ncbi:hypothetical protein [Crateriforma conspicua]|uniref:Uncharacterized protein n=1 Tax=Crateriforma conspicua TaxID=2527996 RepID=A0A5C5Y8M6_9PLAN|nr:hypothetical protein [Crateriforma conspicua]TWT71544.1 hypothetical protein Pan14r_38540 [Crateriforma conspicua]
MSTRATIAVRRPSGDYLATYLHFDGYPEHAGRLLEANYLTAEEVETLVQRGDIRCLDSELGEPEYYDAEVPSAVLPTLDSLLDYSRNCAATYVYIFDDGQWATRKLS